MCTSSLVAGGAAGGVRRHEFDVLVLLGVSLGVEVGVGRGVSGGVVGGGDRDVDGRRPWHGRVGLAQRVV